MSEPADWLRVAGRGMLEDGGAVRWSVAEGTRGRRWRWTVVDGGIVRHAGLVEIDVDGRFARLELASADGLLTLHPSADRSELHGNVVAGGGVRPLAFPADETTDVAIASDPFGTSLLGAGEGRCIWVRAGLAVEASHRRPPRLALDYRGVPGLENAVEWPLEE
jgi:hypothetical protein